MSMPPSSSPNAAPSAGYSGAKNSSSWHSCLKQPHMGLFASASASTQFSHPVSSRAGALASRHWSLAESRALCSTRMQQQQQHERQKSKMHTDFVRCGARRARGTESECLPDRKRLPGTAGGRP
eukprot:364518-Chlamydomonas_euryale.AAC.8